MDLKEAKAGLIQSLRTEIRDEKVLQALSVVQRELFVPPEYFHMAYENRPLPIGYDQTISQPFIIALMTEALELRGEEKVLEVGTGSGYQAAILSRLARKIVTVERVRQLAEAAEQLLDRLGYFNVEVHYVSAELGWKNDATYDAIIVTAGAPKIPGELWEQLAEGGRMVIPVGSRYDQNLLRITKKQGKEVIKDLGGCRFVPLVGPGAWEEQPRPG